MNFNGSIWHALWILAPIGALVFVISLLTVRRGYHYFFDPKHNGENHEGDFEPHSARYHDLAKLVIALSAGVIAFLVNTLANQKPPLSNEDLRISHSAPIVVGFFASSIFCLIIFLLWMTVKYEEYCHSAKHDTYKAWKYAVTKSLGMTGFVAFLLGFVWLAAKLFHQ
jgi:H+/gluconate symporter-like permease